MSRSLLLAFWILAAPAGMLAQSFDLVIEGGRVMDPDTGLDAIRHVGITDGVIQAISETPLVGESEIDATGRIVAPGFIDLNTYQHGDPFFRLRAADGVTSVLHLEGGAVDVSAYYEALEGRALIHHGISVSHGDLRLVSQGDTTRETLDGMTDMPGINATRAFPELDDRRLTPAELETLAALVEQGLREGAVAFGFGIEYTPGATHSEILRMVELAARYDASAHMHLRDWDATRGMG